MASRAEPRERGFTLLEVLIALAIVAFGLAGLYATASSSLGGAATAARYGEATAIARSLLAAAGAAEPLAPGEREGRRDGFRWMIETAPAAALPAARDTAALDAAALDTADGTANDAAAAAPSADGADDALAPPVPAGRPLYRLRVTVSWDRSRQVSLTTYRLGPMPAPPAP